jgi:hypothetical protein
MDKFTTTKLSSKAMLVKLTIRRATLSRRDDQVTSAIQAQYNDQSLTAITKLFRNKSSPIYSVMQSVSEVYQYHKNHTLPYVDAGPRILPNGAYFEYTTEMRSRIAHVDAMLNQWMPVYDQLVRDDILHRNGGLATGRAQLDDYPDADEFRTRMQFDLRFQPMPDAKHFLFDLTDEDEAAFDRSINEALTTARNDTINRMLEPLKHLVDKLNVPIKENGSVFRDSAIQNVLEGCRMARKLAIDTPPELMEDIQKLETLVTGYAFSADALRESPATRESAAKRLADIASKMGAFYG